MANVTTSGPPVKKETVYSGPPLPPKQGTVYNGQPSAAGGTVYQGPTPQTAGTKTGGTVYGGPAYSGPGNSGTVYNPRQTVAQQQAAPAAHSEAVKGAGLFFLIAGLSVINTLLILAHAPFVMALGLAVTRLFGPEAPMANILFLNAMAVGVVVLLGVFVRHGSKAALLIGMLLYGGDTALFFLVGNAALHVPSIIVHVLFLAGMFKIFGHMES
jgi:hypothetical protein